MADMKILSVVFLIFAIGSLQSFDGTYRRTTIPDIDIEADVAEPLRQMHQSGESKKEPSAAKVAVVQQKKTKLNSFKGKLEGASKHKGHAAAKGMISLLGGIPKLIKGAQNGDVMTVLSGALAVAAGIAHMFAMISPIGGLVATVLTFVSSIFGLFGGTAAAPKESEEDMIKRVVETAISDAQIKELKEEIQGVSNLYQTLADSLSHLREINEKTEAGEENTESVSIEQGIALYNNAFQELVPFGKLKEAIKEHCAAGILNRVDRGRTKKDHNDNVEKSAKNCASFIRLYTQLSIQRQFLLTDMTTVLYDAAELSEAAKNALNQTALNFVYLMQKEQERDKDLLKFLVDPINFPDNRYAVSYFYDYPGQNTLALSYLKTLSDLFDDFNLPEVTACTKNFLEGRCVVFNEGMAKELPESYKSIFVPPGMKLNERMKDDNQQLIPKDVYYGPSIYHGVLHNMNVLFRFDVVKMQEEELVPRVRVCEEAKGGVDEPKHRFCQLFGVGSDNTLEISHRNRGLLKAKSFSVPQGLIATFRANGGDSIGPFYGPDDIVQVCKPGPFSSIKVEQDTKKTRTVKVCAEERYAGSCYRIPIKIAIAQEAIIPITTATTGGCSIPRIKSINIPKGVEVTGFSNEADPTKGSYGPFIGPAPITVVDGNNNGGNIKALKIVDTLIPQIELCDQTDFLGNCFLYPVSTGGLPPKTSKDLEDGFVPQSYRIPKGVRFGVFPGGDGGTGPKKLATFEANEGATRLIWWKAPYN